VLEATTNGAMQLVARVYQSILEQSFPGGIARHIPRFLSTDLATAETVKYVANAFLATKSSLINEAANICDLVDGDVAEVAFGMGLDPRTPPDLLAAGLSWGGSRFGKDVSALITTAPRLGYVPTLLIAAMVVSRRQRASAVQRPAIALGSLQGRLSLLGLAFKPGTDDVRDAPALDLAERLVNQGATVTAYDPVVGGALPRAGRCARSL
jgi:nucleotide sugar dehydrogenase